MRPGHAALVLAVAFHAQAATLIQDRDTTAAAGALGIRGRATRTGSDEAPAGLSRSDWSQIRRSIEDSEYHASPASTFVHEAQLFGHDDDIAQFGYTVAVLGDTAVVGAPREDTADGIDAGAAYVFVRAGAVWTGQQRLVPSDAGGNDNFGNSVSAFGDTVVVGAWADDNAGGADAGSAYVFVRSGTTWTEQQKLTASDGMAMDLFGVSLSVSADTVVVCAVFDDTPGGADTGSAYVFVRSGPVWALQQKLLASDGAANDFFGTSVSLTGDTAVVGANGDTTSGLGTGAAYVFVRSGTTWSEQQKLLASDGSMFDQFGAAVSISGDTAVIGAVYDETPGGPAAGSAYVFVRSGTTWTEQQKLLASDGAAGDVFGGSVSISGDTVVVGARDDDNPGGNTGAAYVFVRSGTAWTEQQKLVASDGTTGDRFGYSVSVFGDTVVASALYDAPTQGSAYVFVRTGLAWNEQQKLLGPGGTSGAAFGRVSVSGDTVVVGAYGDTNTGGVSAGSAYVFVRSGTTWTEQQKLLASDGAIGANFGVSVSLSGDTVVIGAFTADVPGAMNGGAAYVFVRSGTTWTEQQKLVASDEADGDHFGVSVSLSGDTVVVGAEFDDTPGGGNAGSAYVFVRSGTTWTQQQKLLAADGTADDRFGFSASVFADTVVVGASEDDTQGGVDAGSAYVFVRSGTTWTGQQKLLASDGAAGDHFGRSVYVSGDTVAIGGDDNPSGVEPGAVYVFVRSGTTWIEQQKLVASDGAAGDRFGISVSFSGETVVVGAFGDDTLGGMNAGSAYVFVRSGTAWTEQPKLLAPDGAAQDHFGLSVAISGDTVVVGVGNDDTPAGGVDAGSAHVFRGPQADLGVTKTDGLTTAVPGQPLTYTVMMTNAGPSAVTTANIADTLPVALLGATWTCSASPGSSCTASGAGNVNDIVSLAVGGTATYTITGTVAPGATGTLSNTAIVAPQGGVGDPNPSNNTATDIDTLAPEAGLSMIKTDSADPVLPNDPLTYVLMIANGGPSDATGLMVSDTLPAGVTFVSSVPGPPTCNLSAVTLTCDLGALLAGGSSGVTMNVSVNAAASGILVNTATVSGNEPDPDNRDNSDSEATSVGRRDGELAHGSDAFYDLAAEPGPLADEDAFRMNQKPYSSYEIVVDATSGDIGAGAGPLLERIAPDGSTIVQTSSSIGTGSSRSLRWTNATATEVEGETIRVRSASCGTDCGPDDVYRIRAYETTCSIPRFNNAGTQVTVLILQNPAHYPISGEILFRNPAAVLLAVTPFSLSPKATLILNTATIPGVNGVSGAIAIAHDARYGELSGKTVALEPATGFSFDSPLLPRIR